jgi:hypothetical protein
MKRGSVWPLLLIITVFLTIPLGYWYFGYRASQNDIKGAKTTGIMNGLFIIVDSNNGTWDLNSYLCKTKSECLESSTSGIKLDTKSGGKVAGYEVNIVYQDQWNDYSFLKLFVKSGWGTQARPFRVLDRGVVTGTSVEKINSDNFQQSVVLVPVKELVNGFYKGAEFSDQ